MHVMSSSLGPGSPDRPVARSSHDQEKPAETEPLAVVRHRGWVGVSDPMPRSVIDNGDDQSVKTRWWHEQQAHARAMRAWAHDPRGEAWVPGRHIDVQVLGDHAELFVRDEVVIRVRVEAFLLDAKLDPVEDTIFGMPMKTDASLPPDGWRLDGVELKAGHTHEVRSGPHQGPPVYRYGPGGDAL